MKQVVDVANAVDDYYANCEVTVMETEDERRPK